MKFRTPCVVPSMLILWLAGCSTAPPVRAVLAAQPTTVAVAPVAHLPPLFLHLPGIGGSRRLDTSMVEGVQKGGFTGEVQIYDWTCNDAGLRALLLTQRNKQQAHIVADKITARFDADPAAPIILCSHSGGGGIAIWALEDLPARVKVDTLLLLAPAVSPKYDLTRALSHVSHHAYVFSSLDDPVLGFGCRMLGTIDGVKTDAAGRVGFIRPPQADATEYEKLIPVPYDPAWRSLDDYGDHIGAMTHKFARLALAPLILVGRLPTTQPITASAGTH